MQYKTIALELLTANPPLHDRLKASKEVLATVNRLAIELKANHLLWIERLTARSGADDPRLIASQALELAVAELHQRLLPSESAEAEATVDLDSAMAYLRRHTPPA